MIKKLKLMKIFNILVIKNKMLNNIMYKLIIESVIIGCITSILGNIIIHMLNRYNSYEKNDNLNNKIYKYKQTYLIQIALFLTGFLIHLSLEYIGLDKWYCEKKCIKDKCNIVCIKKV